eukprot:19082-Chlamydomonas_euryale.AAC.1
MLARTLIHTAYTPPHRPQSPLWHSATGHPHSSYRLVHTLPPVHTLTHMHNVAYLRSRTPTPSQTCMDVDTHPTAATATVTLDLDAR